MVAGDSDRTIAHDVVVIGASAGGIEALTLFVAELPPNLPAAIFVVVHIPADAPSTLSQVLDRSGPLPVLTARDRASIERGSIYIAPPDHHLLLTHAETRDEMRVVHGPRENRNRPAIDPLFRSAALAFGPRVVGIILSGVLDDGAAGLLAIKRAGGIAMVQDPSTAAFPGMPESAISYVSVARVLPIPALAEHVVALATPNLPERARARPMAGKLSDNQKAAMRFETDIAGLKPGAVADAQRRGRVSSYTCPDCHGPLWEIQEGPLLRFRCRVGHAFTAESMSEGQADNVEEALWIALNTIEESQRLYVYLATKWSENGRPLLSRRFAQKAAEYTRRAAVIRSLLGSGGARDRPVESTSGAGGDNPGT